MGNTQIGTANKLTIMSTTTEQPIDRQKQDHSQINRMKILNVMQRHWREKFDGLTEAQFDFLSDISFELADQLPSGVLLKDADRLSPDEILQSEAVQKADLTKSHSHDIPYAKKKPPEPKYSGSIKHKGFIWVFLAWVILSVITIIASYYSPAI